MHLTPGVAVCRLNNEEQWLKHCWKDLADTPKRENNLSADVKITTSLLTLFRLASERCLTTGLLN